MKRSDAPGPEARGAADDDPEDTTPAWLVSQTRDGLAAWYATAEFDAIWGDYLIDRHRTALAQRRQWAAEAAEVRAYTATLPEVSPDPLATALVRDMTRYEAEGKVVWTGDTWRLPTPPPRNTGPFTPLTADQLLSRFEKVRRRGNGWVACCPAHPDQHPSLSIAMGREWWLLLCRSQHCPLDRICHAVRLTVRDLALQGGDDG